mgnify:CR=1 FL=1
MKSKKYSSTKLNEYRIKYNAGAGHSANDSYHYYQAETAEQALYFHDSMMSKRNLKSQTISVEKKDPYTTPPQWVDRSAVISHEQ